MFANLRIAVRLSILTLTMIILMAVIAALGFRGMGSMEVRMKSMYEDQVVSLGQLSGILDSLHRIRVRMIWVVEAGNPEARAEHAAKIAEYEAFIDTEWKTYISRSLNSGEKALTDRFSAEMALVRGDRARVAELLKAGDSVTARGLVDMNGEGAVTDTLKALQASQIGVAKDEFLAAENIYDSTFATSLTIIMVGLAAALLVTMLIGRSITVPVAASIRVMERLARDDISVEVTGQDRGDEVGDIARSVQVFKQNAIDKKRMEAEAEASKVRAEIDRKAEMDRLAGEFEAGVAGVVNNVAGASGELEHTAQAMSALASQVAAQASAVAAASEEAATNVQTVAAATEELSSSVAEIGRQVSESARVSRNAVEEAAHTDSIVRGLSEAAGRIGEVINLINDIASQTNLLALNATIEAARAGEAGKGFAVVANEVKNLANQTAKATEEIGQQITAVQTETSRAVDAIHSVSATIGRIDEISSAIASAVEEQSAATQEIARNVEEAARGTHEVSSNISGVTSAAGETGTASQTVLDAARRLTGESGVLRSSVSDFVARVRNG